MGWDRLGKWISATIAALLVLTAALGAIEPTGGATVRAAPAAERGRDLTPAQAQTDDQPPIEQVGEGTADDPEPLDEGGPSVQTTSDPEPLDTTRIDAPADVEDIETLDQGSPPTASVATTTTTTAPVTTTATTAPAPVQPEPTGPVLPPGFGSGRVQVSAGRGAFPVGLDECHVGVVTGRAFVGLDCDEMDDVVGHARSFDDFPFIPNVDFPFEGDEPFFVNRDFPFESEDDRQAVDSGFFFSGRDDHDDHDDTRLVISAGNGASGATDDEIARRGVAVSGDGSIELAQRTRDRGRDPIERVRDRNRNRDSNRKRNNSGNNANSNNRRHNGGNNNVSSASSDDNTGKSSKKSRNRNKNRKKDKANRNNQGRATSEQKQKAKDGKKRSKRDKKKRDKKRAKREKRKKDREKKRARQESAQTRTESQGDN